jgi:xylulokinase
MTRLDPKHFSSPICATTNIGKIRPNIAAELHISKEAAIIVGSHDQTCGTIGCGVIKKGQTMNATGTVEVLMALTDHVPSADGLLKYHFPCIPHVINHKYSIMSINQNAGILLKWYKNNFCGKEESIARKMGIDPYRYIIESSSDYIADVFVLPHLNGCETPLSDPESAAAILRMRVHHTKADITRAVLDSMAYDLRQNIDALASIGITINELQAIGGGSKTPKLLQIKSDCTQKIIHTTKVSEAASLGAAIIAAVGVNVFPDITTAVQNMVQVHQTFYPDSTKKDEYDHGYHIFSTLYDKLKDLNHHNQKKYQEEVT